MFWIKALLLEKLQVINELKEVFRGSIHLTIIFQISIPIISSWLSVGLLQGVRNLLGEIKRLPKSLPQTSVRLLLPESPARFTKLLSNTIGLIKASGLRRTSTVCQCGSSQNAMTLVVSRTNRSFTGLQRFSIYLLRHFYHRPTTRKSCSQLEAMQTSLKLPNKMPRSYLINNNGRTNLSLNYQSNPTVKVRSFKTVMVIR